MQYVDVVVDGEFHVEEKDAKLLWKGSRNQRVIDVKKTLQQTDPEIPVLHCPDYSVPRTFLCRSLETVLRGQPAGWRRTGLEGGWE